MTEDEKSRLAVKEGDEDNPKTLEELAKIQADIQIALEGTAYILPFTFLMPIFC